MQTSVVEKGVVVPVCWALAGYRVLAALLSVSVAWWGWAQWSSTDSFHQLL